MTEHNVESDIICPYCDFKDEDSWEVTESDDNHQCPSCDKRFVLEIESKVEYSTKRIPCEKKHKLKEKHYLVYINDTHWDYKTDITTPLSKKDWEYREVYNCENCDEQDTIILSEEEFKKKYPDKYENTIRKMNQGGKK